MSLARRSVRGAMVLSAGNLAGYVLSLLGTVVLARFLEPSHFGQATLAITLGELLCAATTWNFPVALLREPEGEVQHSFNVAIYLFVWSAIAIIAIACIGAAVLWFLEGPLIGEMFLAVVVGRLTGLLADCYGCELYRRYAYGRITAIQLTLQVFSNGSAAALAAAGVGAWSLAWYDMAPAYLSIVLMVLSSRWRFHRGFDRVKARELFVFGRQMSVSRLGDLTYHRYDNIIVGLIAGNAPLGLYSQAYLLAQTGNNILTPTMSSVSLSTYARLQDDPERTQRMYDLITFFVARLVAPLAVIMLLVPADLLTVPFGPVWAPGANMLRGLTAYAVLLPIFEHHRALLVAHNALHRLIRVRVYQLAVLLPGVPALVVPFGGTGSAVAVGVSMVVGTVAVMYATRPLVRLHLLSNTAKPLAAAVVAAALGELMVQLVSGDLLQLVSVSVTVVVAYVAMLVVLDRRSLGTNIRTMVQTIRSRDEVGPSDQPAGSELAPPGVQPA
jgi:O-antigen/teichoic acid export membrane protein